MYLKPSFISTRTFLFTTGLAGIFGRKELKKIEVALIPAMIKKMLEYPKSAMIYPAMTGMVI